MEDTVITMTVSQPTKPTPPATIRRHLAAGRAPRRGGAAAAPPREQTLILYGYPDDSARFEEYDTQRPIPYAIEPVKGVTGAGNLHVLSTLDGRLPPCYRISQLAYDNPGDLRADVGSDDGKAMIADLGLTSPPEASRFSSLSRDSPSRRSGTWTVSDDSSCRHRNTDEGGNQ